MTLPISIVDVASRDGFWGCHGFISECPSFRGFTKLSILGFPW